MNTDRKILNKILAKIKGSYKLVFILGMQGWFSIQKSMNVIHHISQIKDKNHKMILRNAKKLTKFNTFHGKNS